MVCFPAGTPYQVYALFESRYNLYKSIYNHPKVQAIDLMVCDAMQLADPVLKIAERIQEPSRFATLSDLIIYDIKVSKDEELKEARELLKRIDTRLHIYKYLGELLLSKEQAYLFRNTSEEDIVNCARSS